jgi:hypothetical protein
MMIGVHGLIQQRHTGHRADDIHQRSHHVGIPPLTEIRHAFDDLIHINASSAMTIL